MNVFKNITLGTENVNNVINVLKNITHATENVNNVILLVQIHIIC